MDKAQARILSLVLIAVLFIGQAIYNYIKKASANRPSRQRPHNKPHSVHQRVTPRHTDVHQHINNPINSSERAGNAPFLDTELNTEPSQQTMSDKTEPTPGEPVHAEACEISQPSNNDLRRMVVWNEILKRKF